MTVKTWANRDGAVRDLVYRLLGFGIGLAKLRFSRGSCAKMKTLIILASLHGSFCDQLADQKQFLQAQWNYFVFASSGFSERDLADVPLRHSLVSAIRRYNRLCE